jgi:nucleoid-associated protein YgaU
MRPWILFAVAVGGLAVLFARKASALAPPRPVAFRRRVIKAGESLAIIAKEMYGDALLWPLLWQANRAVVGDNPAKVVPGQTLDVQDLAGYSPEEVASARSFAKAKG